MAQIATDHGLKFRIIDAVLEANDATTERMTSKIEEAFQGLEGKTVAVLGLSFKPETDDIRESPALTIIRDLLGRGAQVRAFDPASMEATREEIPEITYCDDSYQAAEGADGLVILTEWNQFRALEMDRLSDLLRQPLIVDLRNIYEPEKVAAAGVRYVSIGRPSGKPPLEDVARAADTRNEEVNS